MLYVSEMERIRLEAYRQYKNGFLPDVGGWLDQPTKFVQIMGFIENAIAEVNEKDNHGNERS